MNLTHKLSFDPELIDDFDEQIDARLVQAAKAVRDELQVSLDRRLKALEEYVSFLKQSYWEGMTEVKDLVKTIPSSIHDEIPRVKDLFEGHIETLRGRMAEVEEGFKERKIAEERTKRLEHQTGQINDHLARLEQINQQKALADKETRELQEHMSSKMLASDGAVKGLSDEMEKFLREERKHREVMGDRIDELEALVFQLGKSYQEGTLQIKQLLKSLPTVVVRNEIPPPRLTTKSIQYDEFGRPTQIEEKELGE